jgi:Tfp pilus assembly protein PilF
LAGRQDNGFIAAARVVPQCSIIGEAISLVVSVRNVNEQSVDVFMNYLSKLDADVLLRDAEGRQVGDAENACRRILRGDPNNAGATHLLGVVCHQQGDHKAAIELICRAIGLSPQNAVFLNNYGLPLHSLGRFTEALNSFRRALEINPKYP